MNKQPEALRLAAHRGGMTYGPTMLRRLIAHESASVKLPCAGR